MRKAWPRTRSIGKTMDKPFITTKGRNKKLWSVSLVFLVIWFMMISSYGYMSKMDISLAVLFGYGFHNVTDQAYTVFDKLSNGFDGNDSQLSNESGMDHVYRDLNGSEYHDFSDSTMGEINGNSTNYGDFKSQNDLEDNVVNAVNSVTAKTDSKSNIDDVENVKSLQDLNRNDVHAGNDADPACRGRYVYVHEIPSEFNDDLLRECRSLSSWTNMCLFSSNMGLGPPLQSTGKVFPNTSWFDTDQFLLEVIFHNRMKQYKCLTKDSSTASAIFVPYYAGLDISRYLWGFNASIRDSGSLRLVNWLSERPEWTNMWGRDHFMIAGRITWDFRRADDGISDDWGNRLLLLPESVNMSTLVIEKSPWNNNDVAIPYPTYFHPANDEDLKKWQQRMRRRRRKFLFSFAGAPRPGRQDSIRNEIIDQCKAARRKCEILECDLRGEKCHQPVYVMTMFQSSAFCLQPPGDSYTRRSAFDSILAGCIPVFFHPGSAYIQYQWHLPKDHTRYSVFISGMEVKRGIVSIEKVLSRIPKAKVVAMREEVIRLIPRVIYADPRSKLNLHEDAFDLTVKGVLERVEKLRLDMKAGVNLSLIPEEATWKYSLFGTLGEHEWDPFFYKKVV